MSLNITLNPKLQHAFSNASLSASAGLGDAETVRSGACAASLRALGFLGVYIFRGVRVREGERERKS